MNFIQSFNTYTYTHRKKDTDKKNNKYSSSKKKYRSVSYSTYKMYLNFIYSNGLCKFN